MSVRIFGLQAVILLMDFLSAFHFTVLCFTLIILNTGGSL